MKRVVKIKLAPTDAQAHALHETLVLCNTAADVVSRVAQAVEDRRAFALQKAVYHQLKALGLSAQPAVRTIKKVADAYATRGANLEAGNYGPRGGKRATDIAATAIGFRALAAQPFDDRCLSWQQQDSTVSIWTCEGRLKAVRYVCAPWQRELLEHRCGETDLVFRDNMWFLYATVDVPTPEPVVVQEFLGVDLGIVNLAVTSDDTAASADWSGGAVTARRTKYARTRRALQKVGSKSAKRKLRGRREKEHRYATDINHQISKTIVAQAQRTGRGIVLEDLSGIRERVRLAKTQRQQLHSWAYAQLRDFMTYKAVSVGVPLVVIDPRNTSRTCYPCGHVDKANRTTQDRFVCRMCGHVDQADHNAALNIAYLGYVQYTTTTRSHRAV